MTTGIIFDCFGVLYPNAFTSFLRRHEASLAAPAATYLHLVDDVDRGKVGREVLYDKLAAISGVSVATVKAEMTDLSGIDRDVAALVAELKPRYQIGMLTNVDTGFLQPFLDNHGVRELFDVIVVSSELGVIKPEPAIYERIAERMGKPYGELVFIDDKAENITAAGALGIDGILFQSAAQTREELQRRKLI